MCGMCGMCGMWPVHFQLDIQKHKTSNFSFSFLSFILLRTTPHRHRDENGH